MKPNLPLARASLLLACSLAAAGGCCFAHTERTVDIDMPPLPPPDPSLEALQVCLPSVMVEHHCPFHSAVLSSDVFVIGVGYRTHDLARFAVPGTFVAFVGEGAGRTEIRRFQSSSTAGTRAPLPGETLTWNEGLTLRSPEDGWPVGVPVGLELLDASGAVVAATTVSFSGPRIAPPPLRPLESLAVCVVLAGPEADPFCPETHATIPGGSGQVHATYSSTDPALVANGATIILERHGRRDRWEEESRLSLEASVLPAGETETLNAHWGLDGSAWTSGSEWRVRLEANGHELAVTAFAIE